MSANITAAHLCLALVLSCSAVHANTLHPATCAARAVQSAIDSARTGDTIQVPAGSCSWDVAVSIPNPKKITLRGMGPDSTSITRSPAGIVLQLNQSGSRVTGFAFDSGTIAVDGDDWRIDHNRFVAPQAFFDSVLVAGGRPGAHPRGVIDHNHFTEGARVIVLGWVGLAANVLWSQPLALGAESGQKVFVEDNTFTFRRYSGVMDTNYGGRFVFRHNTVINGYVEVHSLQQGRGSRSWEIHHNTFSQNGEASLWVPFFIRGGSGVIFSNTVRGSWSQPTITLDNVRSFSPGYDYGPCNGHSPADGNQLANGWPCRDQIGRGSDSTLWTTATPHPPQVSAPAYFWNNTGPGGREIDVLVHNRSEPWIVAGRDYFNNTPRPTYTPFSYPHPLAKNGEAAPPTVAPR